MPENRAEGSQICQKCFIACNAQKDLQCKGLQ